MVPIEELKRRWLGFQRILQSKNIEGTLLVQRADTLYFSGTAQNVHVYIPAIGEPLVMAYRDIQRAQEECPWEIVPLTGISKIPQLLAASNRKYPKVLGLEFDVLPVANYQRYGKAFVETQFVDIAYPLRLFRAIKSNWEIARIAETGKIYTALYDYVSTILHPGMSEVELDGLLELKARTLGHETMVRVRGFGSEFHYGQVSSGPRAALPSYFDGPLGGLGASYTHPLGSSHTQIVTGEPIIMDLVMVKEGYQIDTTRILVIGELSGAFRTAYESSLLVEEKTRQALVPGRTAEEVYEEILLWVQNETPYAENFMGFGPTQVKFVGHGIGLELDELPTISKGAKEVLQPGMTIAIEPKFVFPGKGAIGVEDTVVVEGKKGARYLCQAPREIVQIKP
ncbi:Xaa-Pro peptidase family protein [Desulfitobacterium sp.]|uniref:Xaa-Pro peptidase family protein n=1 Tax=Desulfitobacterium sp. TaxID=49981 RepID=UPI002C34EDA7|nr:Xaa-Pro peptidase family protein [Desulfitobacterium sp.]HVJ48531.1 Xaa-Pro peptidase family protein [Desulfitobacterium sp.]